MVPSRGGWAQLRGRLIVCRSEVLWLWAELLALAPGARCRLGRSVGSGAPRAMQWTATEIHAGNVRDPSRVLEQGPDRQRAPDGCSGGVSSIGGASESRCNHDGPAAGNQQQHPRDRHRSSWSAISVHEVGVMVFVVEAEQHGLMAGARKSPADVRSRAAHGSSREDSVGHAISQASSARSTTAVFEATIHRMP